MGGIGKTNMTPADIRTEYIYRDNVECVQPSAFRRAMREIIEKTVEEVIIMERAGNKLSFKQIKSMVLNIISQTWLEEYKINTKAINVITHCIKKLAVEIGSPEYIRLTEKAITRAEDIMLGKSTTVAIREKLNAGAEKMKFGVTTSRSCRRKIMRRAPRGKGGKAVVKVIKDVGRMMRALRGVR